LRPNTPRGSLSSGARDEQECLLNLCDPDAPAHLRFLGRIPASCQDDAQSGLARPSAGHGSARKYFEPRGKGFCRGFLHPQLDQLPYDVFLMFFGTEFRIGKGQVYARMKGAGGIRSCPGSVRICPGFRSNGTKHRGITIQRDQKGRHRWVFSSRPDADNR
jgi:hypothetical protein